MRGIATVIFVGFVSVILFVLVAPQLLEPIAEAVATDSAVQSGAIDIDQYVDRLLTVLLVWSPLFVLGASVISAVVFYLRRERTSTRRRA